MKIYIKNTQNRAPLPNVIKEAAKTKLISHVKQTRSFNGSWYFNKKNPFLLCILFLLNNRAERKITRKIIC